MFWKKFLCNLLNSKSFLKQIMRFDTSMESLIGIGRSESFADLNNPDFARSLLSSTSSLYANSGEKTPLEFIKKILLNRWTFNPNRKRSRSSQFQRKIVSRRSIERDSQRWKTLRNQWVAQFPPFIFLRSFFSYTQRNWTLKVFHKKRVFRLDFFIFLWPWRIFFRFHFDLVLYSSGKSGYFFRLFSNISKHTQNKMLHNFRFYCSRLQLEPLSIEFFRSGFFLFFFFHFHCLQMYNLDDIKQKILLIYFYCWKEKICIMDLVIKFRTFFTLSRQNCR